MKGWSVSASKSSKLVPTTEGDEPSVELDQLYRRHGAWLLTFVRRRFGHDAAEDLAQETYLRASRAQADVRRPRAFLARIATNLARDRVRREMARPILITGDPRQAMAVSEPDQTQALLLKQVILGLPPRLREVFLLSRFGGLTYEAIAQQCGVSVKTVEWRMTKALAICAARMRD